MKNVSQGLLEFLLSTDVESCFCVDLIEVELPSGLIMYICDGQMPITYMGNTYLPGRWGSWVCSGTKVGVGCTNAEASIVIYADETILMPGWDCTLLQAINLGLFDAALITISTLTSSVYGDTSYGVSIRYSGQMTNITPVGRTTAEGDCKPFTFILNQPMPRKVLQPGCGWVLGDAGCTVDLALYTFPYAVGAGTTANAITTSTAISEPSGSFTQGMLTFTSGKNVGLSVGIAMHIGNVLTLSVAPLFSVALGDTFNAIYGCDHTAQTCLQKFNNQINYGGEPFIPNKETAI